MVHAEEDVDRSLRELRRNRDILFGEMGWESTRMA